MHRSLGLWALSPTLWALWVSWCACLCPVALLLQCPRGGEPSAGFYPACRHRGYVCRGSKCPRDPNDTGGLLHPSQAAGRCWQQLPSSRVFTPVVAMPHK